MNKLNKNKIISIINKIGISNLIVIVIFIIALLFFIFFAIKNYLTDTIFNEDIEEIQYDYENSDFYSVDAENNQYKLTLIDNYAIFFNIEDIIKAIYMNLNNNNYDKIYDIFTEEYKNRFDNKESALEELTNLYENINSESSVITDIKLDEVYNIENSNIYICYINGDNDERIKLVLNIDFNENLYKICYIEI